MLACRNCRVALTAESGCATCGPVKANLVDTDEKGDERASLSETAGEAVAALRSMLRSARAVLRDPAAGLIARTSAGDDVVRVANSVAKVVESARKLAVDAASTIAGLSFAERAELFVSWYVELPPGSRRALRSKMDEFESAVLRPVDVPELAP